MAEAYATVTDYTDRTGAELDFKGKQQVTALLVDASALIRRNIPAGFTPDPDITRALAVKIVGRARTNPGGLRSKTVGGRAETYGEDGGLYITEAEATDLQPPADDEGGGVYTVTLRDEAFPPRRHGGRREPHYYDELERWC